jgi:hypothetical protein
VVKSSCRSRDCVQGALTAATAIAELAPVGGPPLSLDLLRFLGGEGVAVYLEGSGFGFAGSAAEGVNRWPDGDVNEADLFEHLLPACAR